MDLNDQLTSGGLPVTTWMPCWNVQEETRQREIDMQLAGEQREDEERSHGARVADALVGREAAACARVAPIERTHSPFVHRNEIISVLPHKVAGVLRGVTVTFRAVPGLDAGWMRRDIACHQAHVAVVGHVPPELAGDPTLINGAEVMVRESRDGLLTVTVTEQTLAAAQRALATVTNDAAAPIVAY
jgi:hypothetical protein